MLNKVTYLLSLLFVCQVVNRDGRGHYGLMKGKKDDLKQYIFITAKEANLNISKIQSRRLTWGHSDLK